MYLTKKLYVSEYINKKIYKELKNLKIKGLNSDEFKNIKGLTFEVGYWRKVNEIHAWFVKNLGEGNDDCNEIYVTKEDFESLLDLVNQVLKNHNLAGELLPTEDGFFFGETEYNEYYFENLKYTKELLEKILNKNDFNNFNYYYHASW